MIPLPTGSRPELVPPQGKWKDLDVGIPFCALVTVLYSLVTGNNNRELTQMQGNECLLPKSNSMWRAFDG
eukprot:13463440-Alexandrium_andersonii.AAC.1